MSPVATICSARLGGTDGVSIEAGKWADALSQLGFTVRRVAGELRGPRRPDDAALPAWGLTPSDGAPPPEPGELLAALAGSDLVVVENLCSLPVRPDASLAAASALERHRGRILLHHHDLPWQRRHLARYEDALPPRLPDALHVTINLRSMRELHARGIVPVTALHNRFDVDAPPGDRAATRTALGIGDEEVLLLQPGRAIERKNVPGGIRFAAGLQHLLGDRPVRYWLTGPAEDGYGPTLERVLARSPVEVLRGEVEHPGDAYAASDVVVFPSTWEGFGNPTIESVVARRPLAVGRYPVLAEIVATGMRFFDLDDPGAIARFLRAPDEGLLEANRRRARAAFSLAGLPAALDEIFRSRGWRW